MPDNQREQPSPAITESLIRKFAMETPRLLPPHTGYTLTGPERAAFQGLSNGVSTAQLELDKAQARFTGALAFLLSVHGFTSGNLAPDFSRITPTATEPQQDAK